MRILGAVSAAITARHAALGKHNAAQSSLLGKKERLEKSRAGGGKEEKTAALSREVTEAEEAANLAKAEYEGVAARVDAEMGRFQAEKLVDFKRIVSGFISLQLEYSSRIQQAWRELLPRLEEIDVSGGADGAKVAVAPAQPIEATFTRLSE